MAALRNPKHEKIAQELAAGRSAEEASASAGYNPGATSFAANARKRAQRHGIPKRVAEIRAPAIKRAEDGVGVTTEWLLTKCFRIADPDLGRQLTKVSDQVAALRLAAQVKGLLSPGDGDGSPSTVIVKIMRFGDDGNQPPKQLAPA